MTFYRMLVLTPTGADAQNCREVLVHAGISCHVCPNLNELVGEFRLGAGALLIAEEGLVGQAGLLKKELAKQPAWSDIPIVILAAAQSLETTRVLEDLSTVGSVILLERPLKRRNLIASARMALRARTRQYEVQTMIEQRDRFLAMLGHELRNPLSPIRNGLHIMKQFPSPPEVERARGIIERQTLHLTRIVDDLLEVARIINGKIALQKKTVDLCDLVRQAADDQRPNFDAKGLGLHVEIGPEKVWVDGDPTRLTQVVSNLLVNAWKFTDRGHVKIKLEATSAQANISVTDTGIGITENVVRNMFEIFHQGDESLGRTRGGLGLGLALCRRLVELHGGTIHGASEGEQRGATFTVSLPRIAPPSSVAPAQADQQTRSLRILIIEDNVDAAESLQMVLQFNGHVVDVAHTGKTGIERALKMKPDFVLCDIGLPEGVSGFDVARQLRQYPQMRLIALTGYGRDEDQRAAIAAGFAMHLTKPVDLDKLERLLQFQPVAGAPKIEPPKPKQ